MRLTQYSFFATVAKHQSLTKASAELRVSQPSISQQLRQLETRYGEKLYRRMPHGVAITEAGELLLRDIAPILEQVGKLEEGFTMLRPKFRKEVLRVGGVDSSFAVLLPTLVARLRQQHPTVTVDLRAGISEIVERLVSNGAVDLAVMVRKAVSTDVTCEPLRREHVAMFARSNHRLARKPMLQLADLNGLSLIVRGGPGGAGVTDKALKQLAESRVAFTIAMRCDGPTAIKAAVRERMGVGMVYEDTVKAEVKSGEFKILKIAGLDLEGQSYIIYSKKRPLSPLAQEFLELLRETAAKDGERDEKSAPRRHRFAGKNPLLYLSTFIHAGFAVLSTV
ncbi:MAG: LysR family transcriptional regulator [Chloroflexota bacterium]